MVKALFRFFNAIHIFLFRLTRGRRGGKIQGLRVLLLSTIGRRTGKRRVTPLGYFQEDGGYIIIASNAGFDRHPGWFHNLTAQPRATIELGDRVMSVEARMVRRKEYAPLWAKLIDLSPGYARYAKRTKRLIPLVALTPSPLAHHPESFGSA